MSRLLWAKDADGDDEGFASGKRIGRNIERAVIDGRCFTRPAMDDGEKLHAVILLDRSGSMRGVIGTVGGVAQGFADALRRVAETVHLGVFSRQCEPVQHFRDVTAGGGTATDEAIEWAMKELNDKRGRRLILCITDGVPASPERTIDACNGADRSGTKVVGVAYGMSAASLRASMGTATIIEARSPVELACQLSRVAARVGA